MNMRGPGVDAEVEKGWKERADPWRGRIVEGNYVRGWRFDRAEVLRASPEARRRAMLELSARERRVTEAWLQGRTFGSIAAELGVSYARAHQIHAKAFRLMRQALP
jgi:DNA-directed RNA polymerase specialized sigma24 family protein